MNQDNPESDESPEQSAARIRTELLNDCDRSMRYHQARTRFYNSSHLWIQFVLFVFTTIVAAFFIKKVFSEDLGFVFLAVVNVLVLFSLVWNPADKAGLHKLLYRDFTKIAGDIASTAKANEAMCAKWTQEIQALYAQEPPAYRALNAHCYNQVSLALGVKEDDYFVKLRWYHRRFRNVCPFQGTDFPILKKKKKVRAKSKRKSVKS